MLYHVLTSPVADVTGTVTVYNSAGQTTTAAASQIVRPSDWNSAHVELMNFAGNTAGTSQISGTNLYFAGGNNITLSANGQTVSIVGAVGGGGGVALSAGTNSTSTGTVVFANSNGLSFGMDTNGQVTGTVKTDYLTTAALSNHSHNLATTTTNGSQIVIATTNSNGATMAVPPFITTYVNDLTSGRAGTGFTSTTTAGTAVVGTLNTNGLSIGVPAFLTTAAQSNHSHNFATTTTNGSQIVVGTTNSAGATIGVPPFLTTAQPVGAYLTTARASNDAIGLNTAQTNVTWTVNSSGLSLNAAGYAGTGTTYAGTNVNATLNQNSNGLALSLSAAGGGTINQTGPNIADSASTITSGTVVFSNANGVSFGLNGQTMTASVSAAAGVVNTMWFPFNEAVNVLGQQGQGTLHFCPVPTPDIGAATVSFDRLCVPMLHSHATNSTGSVTLSLWFGLYTRENTTGTRVSLEHSTSFTTGYTFSGTQNSSILSGVRLITIPWTSSVQGNRYVVGMLSRTTTGGANATVSQVLISNLNSNFSGIFGAATTASAQWPLGWGHYSATTSALPGSVAYSQIYGTNSNAMRNPEWFMVNGTA